MGSRVTDIALKLARTQHGIVGWEELREAGIPASTIQSRVDSSFLFPVFKGVYLVGRNSLSQDALLVASLKSAGEGAVLGGRSAATLWGFMRQVSPVDVYRPLGGVGRSSKLPVDGTNVRPFLLVHRSPGLPMRSVRIVRGIRVASVAATLLQVASLSSEETFHLGFLEADRLGLIDDEELSILACRTRGHRGGRRFREHAQARIPDIRRARSVLEAIYLDLRSQGVVPPAEVNVKVLGRESDLVWRDRSVIVELDGYEFHRGREAFENDAMRNNQLRASGWSVLRITWRMLNQRPKEVSKLILGVLGGEPIGLMPK